ncbi:MAG: hypothetical protein COA54_04320 [Thiotrichaceae bacterium]|nr:MAG: hypothetical protein COA54_04320 [Thiotrichaceae bacterium]
MSFELSNYQNEELIRFWKDIGGLDRLTDNFINELNQYRNTTPELITTDKRKIETEERERYLYLSNTCSEIIRQLDRIPEIDRINLLSENEERRENGGSAFPMYDPLDYIKGLKERAERHRDRLKHYVKYERQFIDLKSSLRVFHETRCLKQSQFIFLFCLLFKDANDKEDKFTSSVEKALNKIGYKYL